MKPSKVLLGSFALGLLVLGGMIIFKSNSPAPRQPLSTAITQPPASPPVKSDPVPPTPVSVTAVPQKHPALTDFRNWADDFLAGKKVDAAQGERFAMNRRNYMRHLIKTDPEQAIAEAAPALWRQKLPGSVTQYFESRVDDRGAMDVRVGTDFEQGTVQVSREVLLGEQRYDAYVYGGRRAQMSQTSMPIHGVAIDKYLAIQQDALRLLEPVEVQAAGLNASEEICGVSTKPADSRTQPVVANDGKRNRMFCGIDHYRLMNEQWLAAEGGSGGGGGLGRGKVGKDTWNQGAKTVLYMRLNFPDDLTEPITEAGAYANMNSVNDFYVEGSYNTCQMLPTVTPLMTLPHPKSYYTDAGAGALQNDARQLAREIGYETARYDRDIVAFTSVPGYDWGGLASVGGKGVWLQGYGVGVTSHELGHNEGLWHANWWNTSANSSIIGVGTHIEYGNVYDTMGSAGAGANQFNAMHKWRMDWLPERYIHDITTNGTYRLYPYDVPQRTNTHFFAAKIHKDWQRDYWLEMRQRFSSNPWLVYGVSVNWSPWDESSGGTHLLDTTPGTPTDKASREDAAVTIGRTFGDYVNGVYITPIARGGIGQASWIDVVVNTGAFPSNHVPTLAIVADVTNVVAGARINFSSYATDLDGDTLAYYWDFGDLTFFTNSAPLAFKSWNSDGDHVVRCVVSDMKGGSASANVLVTVGTLSTTNRIMGRITDTNGVPIEGVRIDNEETDPADYHGGYTDSNGNFIIGDVPPGTSLKPVKYGYTFEPATFSTPGGIATNNVAATAMPKVSIAAVTNYVAEPGEFTDIVITRVGDTNSDLAVSLYLSGTATRDSDYSLSSLASGTNFSTITIPAGSNSVSFTLQVLDDNSGEGPETVTLTLAELTNANSYIVYNLGETTVNIVDNDTPVQPSVSISATTSSGDNSSPESGQDNGRFVITRNGSVASDLTVFYSVGGTATAGVDYEALPGVVIIPAGRTSASVEFRTIDDPYVEPEETVNVTITANAAYNGAGGSSTVRIIDDDLVSVTIAPTDGSVGEPSSTGRFTVTRAGNLIPSMVVNYTVSGTASNGVDYQALSGTVTIPAGETTANITVTPIDDALSEGNETVILTVASAATYNVGSPGAATIVIQDDEQIGLSITATDDTASEPGSDTGLITISRGSSTTGNLTVYLAVSGTALAGHDYIPLENSVVIPDGSSSVTMMVTPFNDLHKEPTETVIVTMLANTNYILGSSVDATVNINDDDGSNPPAVGFALASSSAPESRSGGIIVSLSITSSSPITVDYMVYGGTATPTNDFTLPPGTLTFDPGQISKSLPLTVINDNTVESDETIKIVLLNPGGAAHDGNKFHTYTILDDDKSTITVTATAPTATEASLNQGNFRISRSGSTNSAQTVYFDITGTASTPSDYAGLGHMVIIPAGVTSVNLPVIPVDDGTIEVTETVVLSLTSTPGAKIGGADQATVSIIDNDPDNLPAINITAGDALANEGGGDTGNFVFSRVGPSNAALTVFYNIGGTAANGSDYASIASSVSFSAGQTQLVVNVTPINDTTVEGEETVVLSLEMRDTYRIGNPGEATVVILDNDQNVWLETADSYAAEPGWDTGEFTFMRFGVTNTPVTVLYTRTGTASNGVDFISITNSIVIPANANQARLTIVPKDDYLIEPTESVIVTVQNNAAYFLTSPTAGTVFIHDNEPMVWLTSVATNASENGESPGLLLLERGGDPTINLEVFLSFTGTATFGVDYPAFKTNICLPPGVMSALITISPTNELVVEPQETVFAQILPSPSAYTIMFPSNATVTIDDMGTNRFPVALITSPTVPHIFGLTSNLNVMLEATGTDEVVASTNLTFAWNVISGDTNNVIFGDAATNITTVSFTNAGVYVLRLAVSDGTLRGFDTLTVVVDATNLFNPDLLHWTFDEGSGTNAVDASGHGRDGAVTDATWLTNGIRGGALSFNGASNSVMEISGTNFLDGLEALTVAMWVKSSATNAERGLFAGGVTAGTNSALALWQGDINSCRGVSNLLQAVLPTTAGDVRFTSSQKFASNQWQHVALVWTNGQSLALYINGERDLAGSASGALNGVLTNSSQFVIGRGAGTNYWNGQVDDVRLFARALDLGEVRSLAVMPPTNFVPIVDAGTNLTVQIVTPGNLAGQIFDDGQPIPPGLYTNVWQFVGGPGLGVIAEPTNLTTAVSFTNFGNYFFRLIADDGTAKIFDDVMVTVTEPTTVNIFPIDADAAEFGPDEGAFMITRTGDTNFDFFVQLAITGIASNGVDYVTITNAILLPASSNDVTIVIRPFLDNRTEGDEDVTITILPQLAYTIGSPSATVTIHDSPYGVWTINHFTLEELTDPSLSGEIADFDHDRVNNFLEYAFNREPKVADPSSPLAVTIETNIVDNLGHITATYTRRIQPIDVQYQMIISTNMVNWLSGSNVIETLSITPDPNGFTETVKDQIRAPYTSTTIQFLTIRVWRTIQP